MNRIALFFTMSILFLSSCKNKDKNHLVVGSTQTEATTNNNSIIFALKLPQGAKYYFNSSAETVTKLEVENKKVTTTNNATTGLIYEVLQAGQDSAVLKITYDKIHIELTNKDEKQVIDAANTQENQTPLDKVLADIKGSSIQVTLDKKGKVIRSTGSKEIVDKVLAGLFVYDDAETKKVIKTQLGKLVGNDFIETTVSLGFNFYPDSAIVAGQNWSKKSTIQGEMKMDANVKYTLSSIDDGIASIDIESSLTSSGTNKPINMMGQEVVADISQKTSGSMEVDITTGLLKEGKMKSKIEGTIEVMHRVVPIEITSKRIISIKKIAP